MVIGAGERVASGALAPCGQISGMCRTPPVRVTSPTIHSLWMAPRGRIAPSGTPEKSNASPLMVRVSPARSSVRRLAMRAGEKADDHGNLRTRSLRRADRLCVRLLPGMKRT